MKYTNRQILEIEASAKKNKENIPLVSGHKPKTKVQVEHSLGDTLKVVACQLDDLFEIDQLQIAEIKALVKSSLSSWPTDSVPDNIIRTRPKASKEFMSGYHSGNHYTITKSKKELRTKDRLKVISQCLWQAMNFDGLNKKEFLSLCDSYVDEHFDDGEDI